MNHPDQFLPLFLETQSDLRAFIGAMIRDPAGREDIFQEVSMILWNSFGKFDRSRSFGAWARGIAARKILESHRLRARLPEAVPPEVIEAVAEGFESDFSPSVWQRRESALNQCLDQLPSRSGALITDRYTKGRSVEEIADDSGMTAEAIYQALSRLRKQLRDCVERRVSQMNSFF